MIQTKVVEEIKTHILCSIISFFENRAFYKVMGKNICREGKATDDNMAHAHCTMDN